MSYCTGKTAVITGAGSGIGRALAQILHAEGCKLFLSDIDERGLEQTRQSLQGNAQVDIRCVDVADREAMNLWAHDIDAGGQTVDILVNNAGVAVSARVDEAKYEDIQWLMSINFWGVVHGTMAFLPQLKQAPNGHLINISSIFGMIGVPTQSAYNAAKFAVRGYTDSLRQELAASGMHVCCVHPGGIRTNIARRSRGGPDGLSEDEKGARFEKFARTSPESAAQQILRAIEKRKKRLLIGADAHYMNLLARLFPVNYPALLPGLGRLSNE